MGGRPAACVVWGSGSGYASTAPYESRNLNPPVGDPVGRATPRSRPRGPRARIRGAREPLSQAAAELLPAPATARGTRRGRPAAGATEDLDRAARRRRGARPQGLAVPRRPHHRRQRGPRRRARSRAPRRSDAAGRRRPGRPRTRARPARRPRRGCRAPVAATRGRRPTAVGGHSHERVARELGITDGAVRGLLYRARATLRTALTALTPPPLLALLAGRADQSGLAPERLGELAAGGGAAGLGGLLVKGGVAAITAGTLITGAAVVHIQGSAHPRARTLFAAVPHGAVGAASGSSAASTGVVSGQRSLSFPTHGRPGRVRPGGRPHPHGGGLAGSPSALGAAPGVRRGG